MRKNTFNIVTVIIAIMLATFLMTACTVTSVSKPDNNSESDKELEEVTIEATGDFSIKTDEVEISIGSSGIKIDTTGKQQDKDKSEVDEDTLDAVESLYAYQMNFSNGTANLNIIPVPMVEELYDEYDDLKEAGANHIPIMIREYAVTDTVYFDYDTDTSIVWEKKSGAVTIEKTDIEMREAFKEKQHKVSST